jgi:Tol biopolymer transport system component
VNKFTGEAREVHLPEYAYLHDVDCSARAGLILALTFTSGKSQIWIFRPDGSEERELVDESGISTARWSPSGDSVYYLHEKGSIQELSRLSVTGRDAESAVLAGGLQAGAFFTLSADGSRLAYTREEHNSNLWRVDLPAAGKRARPEISRVTSGTSYYGAPGFSPDGRWISFALGSNDVETNIFKMQLPGGEPVQLTFFEHATASSPAWSPDGQRIALINDQGGTFRVWTINANEGTAQPLEHTNASNTSNRLAWWPSSAIVYQQPGNHNFLKINDKTGEEKPVIQQDQSTGWVPSRPVFSPDGKKMAVNWNRKEKGLWIISLEPYSETFLQSGFIFPFGWSPDGRYVYAIRGFPGREIIRVQASTSSKPTAVSTLPGYVVDDDGASVSPDGHEIFVSIREEKSDVWLMENFDPSASRTRTESH